MSAAAKTRPTDLAATFEDDRYSWTRRRSVRRAGVVGEAVLVGALALAALAAGHGLLGSGVFAVVWVVGLVLFIPLHSVVNLGVRGLHDRRETTLDEVQRTQRDRSTAATHWPRLLLSLLAVLVAVQTATSTDGAGGASGGTAAFSVGFVLWFASWLTSTWHLAWTLPEED